MNQDLQRLIVDRGPLLGMYDVDATFRLSCLAMCFAEGTTLLVAVQKDDSVQVVDVEDVASLSSVLLRSQFEDLERYAAEYACRDAVPVPGWIDLASLQPWSALIGRFAAWAWVLTNNFGFQDAVQIEFMDENQDSMTIQLLVAGSTFDIGVVA